MRLFITLLLMFWIMPLRAEDDPATFLSGMLNADFTYDLPYRWGKIYYQDDLGNVVGDCDCSEPRENFSLTWDPYIIVKDWRIKDVLMVTPDKALITVHFTVLGWTLYQAESLDINPSLPPKDNTVEYRIWRINGKWQLVDPPQPRVGLAPIVSEIDWRIDHGKKSVAEYPDREDFVKNLEKLKRLKAALDQIQSP